VQALLPQGQACLVVHLQAVPSMAFEQVESGENMNHA